MPAALARRDVLKLGATGLGTIRLGTIRLGTIRLGAIRLGGMAALAGAGTALAQTETVNIVGAAATAGAALQWIMKEKGFFKKFGLEPNIISVADGSKLMGAVIGGSSDIVVI
jgi:ABC-type nitrate/sulfonate/bicarbonate transport system substrate-binding protein